MAADPVPGLLRGPGRDAPLADWLAWLEQAHPRAWDPGLARVARVARLLGLTRPQRWAAAPRVITVAGTNGKGSTVSALEQLALAAGVSVLATTSPHLYRFNERLRVDGRELSETSIVRAFAAIDQARDLSLTYFEFAALAALWLAREQGVRLLLLEVGLGGRLDAVNIVAADVAVVTSVGIDHQAWLGDTREAIAAEKAGVLRAGRCAVLGETQPPASLLARARTLGCALRGPVVDSRLPLELAPGALAGLDVGPENATSALHAWAVTGLPWPRDPVAALTRAGLPGRCQAARLDGVRVWLDVAHNPAAAKHLAAQLARRGAQPRVALCGQFLDKDAAGLAAALPDIEEWITVATAGPRGQSADALAQRLQAVGRVARPAEDLATALRQAAARAGTLGADLLVCGSFQTVAEAMPHTAPDITPAPPAEPGGAAAWTSA